jgi:hypothetical protein
VRSPPSHFHLIHQRFLSARSGWFEAVWGAFIQIRPLSRSFGRKGLGAWAAESRSYPGLTAGGTPPIETSKDRC